MAKPTATAWDREQAQRAWQHPNAPAWLVSVIASTREHGAAEMRERAAKKMLEQLADEGADGDVYGWMFHDEPWELIRALPLIPTPLEARGDGQ